MQHYPFDPALGFRVLGANARAQVAIMVLDGGDSTGGPDNVHRNSDQWLIVKNGEGQAIVNGEALRLLPGTVLLIEAGEPHELRATSTTPLETINIYLPPEY